MGSLLMLLGWQQCWCALYESGFLRIFASPPLFYLWLTATGAGAPEHLHGDGVPAGMDGTSPPVPNGVGPTLEDARSFGCLPGK